MLERVLFSAVLPIPNRSVCFALLALSSRNEYGYQNARPDMPLEPPRWCSLPDASRCDDNALKRHLRLCNTQCASSSKGWRDLMRCYSIVPQPCCFLFPASIAASLLVASSNRAVSTLPASRCTYLTTLPRMKTFFTDDR